MHHGQTEQLFKRIEIVIAVLERVAFTQAECRDKAVDGLANRTALGAKTTVIAGDRCSKLQAAGLEQLEAPQVPQNTRSFFIGRESLKDLADHQVEQPERLTRELLVEPVRLGRRDVIEIIDPYRRIDDDHGISRPWSRAPAGFRSDRRAT